MDSNALSRLLAAQPLAMANTQMIPPPQTVAQTVAPQQTVAQVSDSERRRQEIAKREEERQRKAREKLANRQAQMSEDPAGPAGPMEADVNGFDYTPMDAYGDSGYGIEDLVGGAKESAEGRMGEMDRKPISEWSKGDWGKLLVDIGGGFSRAQGGDFGSGLSSATSAASQHLQRLDDRAEKWDDTQRGRMDDLDDLMLRDAINRRQTLDERGYRSGERQQDRMHDLSLAEQRRAQELEDRADTRNYNQEIRADERAYAERVAAASTKREDTKEMREAAAKNSRNYSDDYVKLAGEIIKARGQAGDDPPTPDELDALIIPQLQRAYGISGTLGSTDTPLPANRGLSSGY